MTLEVIVVDLETTGRDPALHVAVEVGWRDLRDGESGVFIPPHTRFDVLDAEEEALELNGYRIRGLDDETRWDDGAELRRLHAAFGGRGELAAANPAFDVSFLGPLFRRAGLSPTPWSYRLLDIGTLARGVLGLDHQPSMSEVYQLLGVTPGGHRAEADVTAESLCLLELDRRARGHVRLDPRSDLDAARTARAALGLPGQAALQPEDLSYGRDVLTRLLEGSTR